MKNLNILLLVHDSLLPDLNQKKPARSEPWITEYDVATALQRLGHEVKILGLYQTIEPLIKVAQEEKIDFVFNLLEQFGPKTEQDQHIVSLLEMLKLPYSGCSPKALTLARDKALSKKISEFHHLSTPQFIVFPVDKKKKIPKNLKYPIIVKCLAEEASLGISQKSVVHNIKDLETRIHFLQKKFKVDVICEEFIPGREIYVGVLKYKTTTLLPPIELFFENAKEPSSEIYSENAKWNENYQKRKGIKTDKAKLDKEQETKLFNISKKISDILGLHGYARIDFRLTEDNRFFFLEANPNPNLAVDDEFALAANTAQIEYDDLIDRIVKEGLALTTSRL